MKTLALALLLVSSSCAFRDSDGAVNWRGIETELELSIADFSAYSEVVRPDNPELADKLLSFADTLSSIEVVVQATREGAAAPGATEIDAALDLLSAGIEQFATDAETRTELQTILFLARASLNRVRAYSQDPAFDALPD